MTFSSRYELSRATTIVDDAPKWFRKIFLHQVLPAYTQLSREIDQPFGSSDGDKPISIQWLLERMSQLTRREISGPYEDFRQSRQVLDFFFSECEWFFFFDGIEIIASALRQFDEERNWVARYPLFQKHSNELFQTSAIGWHLDPFGLLQRVETEERSLAETQLKTIELHSPAKVHLAKAREMLRQRPSDSANCIKECVSAIESAGRKVYPKAQTLGDVLKEIKRASKAPSMMVDIVEKLYGFACSEPGVRHGNAADERVTRAEAEFVYTMTLATLSYFEALGIL